MKELAIGQIGFRKGKKVRCEENTSNSCNGCAFENRPCSGITCSHYSRTDGKDTIYKLVSESSFETVIKRCLFLFPIILITILSSVHWSVKFIYKYLRYGGEFITYGENERVTISDIYNILKDKTLK